MNEPRRCARALAGLLTVICFGCGNGERQASALFDVIARYPHDAAAYTQGVDIVDSVASALQKLAASEVHDVKGS